jgi:hypothetical protein
LIGLIGLGSRATKGKQICVESNKGNGQGKGNAGKDGGEGQPLAHLAKLFVRFLRRRLNSTQLGFEFVELFKAGGV